MSSEKSNQSLPRKSSTEQIISAQLPRPLKFDARPMKTSLVILAMLLFANSVRCTDADRKQPDQESLRSYMAGQYDLIGRKPDSAATYTGHVTLRSENGVLEVTRTIAGKIDKSVAR